MQKRPALNLTNYYQITIRTDQFLKQIFTITVAESFHFPFSQFSSNLYKKRALCQFTQHLKFYFNCRRKHRAFKSLPFSNREEQKRSDL